MRICVHTDFINESTRFSIFIEPNASIRDLKELI